MLFKFGEILLPEKTDVNNWAVVACDQYTSQPEYWDGLAKTLKDPTSLNLIFPECYLSEDNSARIKNIEHTQSRYIKQGVFRSVNGTVLVKRTVGGKTRHGLMACVNLDEYSNETGEKPLIRATEGLVSSRIPPRIEIRRNCPLELPHIMLLIDDPEDTVIGPLKNSGKVLYEGELNGKGGYIKGSEISDTGAAEKALNALLDSSEKKYGEKLLFLVGDGNHSLATAKACRDFGNPLSQYALVEFVNIYDNGIVFEPIHRVIFGIDNNDFVKSFNKEIGGKAVTSLYVGQTKSDANIPENPIDAVKAVQHFIDSYISEKGGNVDYIHGEGSLKEICARTGGMGIALKSIDKKDLFPYVVKNGTLPRKTFSMGEANEKRYYIEARFIK